MLRFLLVRKQIERYLEHPLYVVRLLFKDGFYFSGAASISGWLLFEIVRHF